MPKHICETCEIFVHSTYERLCIYKKTQQQFVVSLVDTHYYHRLQEIKKLEEEINEARINRKELTSTKLRELLLRNSTVKPLKCLCIDFFNKNGPLLLKSILKVEYSPLSDQDQEEQERQFQEKIEIYFKNLPKSKRNRYVKSTYGIRKRHPDDELSLSSNQSDTETDAANHVENDERVSIKNIEETKKLKRKFLEEQAATSEKRVLRTLTGATQRVKYVDDIPDEVLFYGQIQKSKRKKLEEKAIMQSIKDAKKGHENYNRKDEETMHNSKLNPGASYQPNLEQSTPVSPTFSRHELVPSEIVNQKCICKYCNYNLENMKALTLHNNIHLRLFVRRIGEKKLLPPQLRKGKFVEINNCKMVRCLNCLRTFASLDFLKQHWILRSCTFYCKICYKNFYSKPEGLKMHMLSIHGVKTDPNVAIIRFEAALAASTKYENEVPSSSGECKLKIKSVSSINASGINGLLNLPSIGIKANPTIAQQNILPPMSQMADNRTFVTKHGNNRLRHLKHTGPWIPRPQFATLIHPTTPLPPPPPPRPKPQIHSQSQVAPQQMTPIMHLNSQVQMFGNYDSRLEYYGSQQSGFCGLGIVPEPAVTPVHSLPITHYGSSFGKIPVFSPCGLQCFDKDEFIVHRKECKTCKFSCVLCIKGNRICGFQTGSELQMHLMLSHPSTAVPMS